MKELSIKRALERVNPNSAIHSESTHGSQ